MIVKADIGLIGMAVMGQNLVLNMHDSGFKVVVYNRTLSKIEDFLKNKAKNTNIIGANSISDLVKKIKKPRKIMLMVKSGQAVDDMINEIVPLLDKGDIIIDGGNSNFENTIRRTKYIESKGLLFVGTGISGGEEGARHGPSIMPGGSKNAWPKVKNILQSIAAKTDDGIPCCDWVGDNGAGHYVKMVHNGIEYGDMQLICESYHLMKEVLQLDSHQIHKIFKQWNQGKLNSYLVEITADIFKYQDTDGQPLIEKILDTAKQKGTGKWTSQSSLDLGVPLNLITESVYARFLSALKTERVNASKILKGPNQGKIKYPQQVIKKLHDALYASKIISYTQGFMLLKTASEYYKWELDLGNIALIWREGCIIRSAFLEDISQAYKKQPNLKNLLLNKYFQTEIFESQKNWRQIVSLAVKSGIPVPAMSSALAFYDSYRTARLPANLLQAQRDYFGAHTYQKINKPLSESFHTDWK